MKKHFYEYKENILDTSMSVMPDILAIILSIVLFYIYHAYDLQRPGMLD